MSELRILPASAWAPGMEGAFSGLPEAIYRAENNLEIGLNFSLLKLIDKSPAHMRSSIDQPEKDTPARQALRAYHCAVLEPERFEQEYFMQTKRGGDGLTELQWNKAMGIQASVRRSEFSSVLAGAATELSVFVLDPVFDLMRKCRIDALVKYSDGTYGEYDLKDTDDARIESFFWRVKDKRWIEQRAYYAECLHMLAGINVDSHIAAIEDSAPHSIIIYPIDRPEIEKATARVHGWLEKYVECKSKNKWPSYPTFGRFERPGYKTEY